MLFEKSNKEATEGFEIVILPWLRGFYANNGPLPQLNQCYIQPLMAYCFIHDHVILYLVTS